MESHIDKMKDAAEASFWGYVGAVIEHADGKQVRATLDVQPHHLNLIGILHGGVHATLVDSAMGLAVMLARPDEQIVTTNLNMHYVRPSQLGKITVTADVIHMSRKMVTAQGHVYNESGELCSLGTGSFRVIDAK